MGDNAMPTAEELREQLRIAEQAERDAARAEADAIVVEYEWEMKWKSKHVFQATRKVSQATLHAVLAWKVKHTKATFPRYGIDDRWEGMEYLLIGNLMAHVGGGILVLKGNESQQDPFSHEPRVLTDEEVAALHRNEIPESLKK